ncbi:putative protein without homology [Propionibacterium freudenreichii subsp. shermanii]|nr:putative protein without homology [Propionibacterium freudenreichii subsp. shermanii]
MNSVILVVRHFPLTEKVFFCTRGHDSPLSSLSLARPCLGPSVNRLIIIHGVAEV